MNIKFNKALYLLDKGKREEGLKLLQTSFEEAVNSYEQLEIKTCMMEVLYELKEYEKVQECIEYILECTSEAQHSRARKIAMEIRKELQEE